MSPIETRPRSSSFSSTPTFSSDLSKLRLATNNQSVVSSYTAAIEIASTFDVLTSSHSPLVRKVVLGCEDDWISFFERSNCVTTAADGSNEVNLEKFLRYCFDIAYKMPASPSTRPLRGNAHVRSVSHGGVPLPVGSPGGTRRASPPQLSI